MSIDRCSSGWNTIIRFFSWDKYTALYFTSKQNAIIFRFGKDLTVINPSQHFY